MLEPKANACVRSHICAGTEPRGIISGPVSRGARLGQGARKRFSLFACAANRYTTTGRVRVGSRETGNRKCVPRAADDPRFSSSILKEALFSFRRTFTRSVGNAPTHARSSVSKVPYAEILRLSVGSGLHKVHRRLVYSFLCFSSFFSFSLGIILYRHSLLPIGEAAYYEQYWFTPKVHVSFCVYSF